VSHFNFNIILRIGRATTSREYMFYVSASRERGVLRRSFADDDIVLNDEDQVAALLEEASEDARHVIVQGVMSG
jgi:hypothetical protein